MSFVSRVGHFQKDGENLVATAILTDGPLSQPYSFCSPPGDLGGLQAIPLGISSIAAQWFGGEEQHLHKPINFYLYGNKVPSLYISQFVWYQRKGKEISKRGIGEREII